MTAMRMSRWVPVALGVLVVSGIALGAILNLTKRDFKLSGTQMDEIPVDAITQPDNCRVCHEVDGEFDPWSSWNGSKMAHAGRNPLFYAQMATANQDVNNVGTFCMRCHVPMSYVTGHGRDPTGALLTERDREGVACHFCHAMVNPVYAEGQSPPADQEILNAMLLGPPEHYGNAMFVLDPDGWRRGPRSDHQAMHELRVDTSFFRSGNFCGTCHEVGNVATSRQPDGTYRYNTIDEPTPSEDPAHQFPLERTFSEWRLSAFANGGVDLGGRFGGTGMTVVSSCQDCHMPRFSGDVCAFGPSRPDARTHEFAGAGAQTLDIIAVHTQDDPNVDQAAIQRSRAAAVSMLERAVDVSASQDLGELRVRVTNQTGHKVPTGHIEGRRVWVNVRMMDGAGAVISEYGAYDPLTAELDEHTTNVYEMIVGLSEYASSVTGVPAGPTGRMALADTIVKDNRIPPRGFANAAFEAAGAPVVGAQYADGQHWADSAFAIPAGAARAEVGVYYQSTPKHYIEMLRDNNQTDHWGQTLHALWEQTGRGAPIRMAFAAIDLGPTCDPDYDQNGVADQDDVAYLINVIGGGDNPSGRDPDFDCNGIGDQDDIAALINVVAGGGCAC